MCITMFFDAYRICTEEIDLIDGYIWTNKIEARLLSGKTHLCALTASIFIYLQVTKWARHSELAIYKDGSLVPRNLTSFWTEIVVVVATTTPQAENSKYRKKLNTIRNPKSGSLLFLAEITISLSAFFQIKDKQ